MKILLAMEAVYYPGFGGANKIMRAVAEQMAARGHSVFVVTPAIGASGFATLPELRRALAAEQVLVRTEHEADEFTLNGVPIHAVHATHRYLAHLEQQIQAHQPDTILVTSEDWDGGLLETALQVGLAPVFVLVNTAIALPFGPSAMRPSAWRKQLVGQAAGLFAISRFLKDYLWRWGDMDAALFYTPTYGLGPYPRLGGFDKPYVTMLNPSLGKGIAILLALAERFPAVSFAAVPTWATTNEDRAALAEFPNVHVLPPQRDIDLIWTQTRVALMPSLWPEGFGLTVVEAMLRGIPVLASNQGGLVEAKLGTEFVLPVAPITAYAGEQRPGLLPTPIVPAQPQVYVDQWAAALHLLTRDRAMYERHARSAQQAAARFAPALTVEPLETQFNASLHGRNPVQESPTPAGTPAEIVARLSGLTAGQRALLQQWLRREQR